MNSPNLKKVSHVILLGCMFLIAWISSGFVNLLFSPPYWLEGLSPLAIFQLLSLSFEKWLWKWRFFRFIKVIDFPDLNGRWEGKLVSTYKHNGVSKKVPIVLEIEHSFSTISVWCYFSASQSGSVICVRSEEVRGKRYLVYTYDNKVGAGREGTMSDHSGTVWLECVGNDKELRGHYYNSNGNQGEIFLVFSTMTLSRQFKQQKLQCSNV